ncbi:MAG TPA: hypothetical protein P5328_02610 [Candidatus Paceibacterota bacterium]|nr:hypothetical protein [Candidatus Paceibacterota bacterium]
MSARKQVTQIRREKVPYKEEEKMQNSQTVESNGFTIVLNGGSSRMESATIPIQWFFDPKLSEERPTHILIIDYTKRQFEDYHRHAHGGRRYVVEVKKTTKFLEFFSAGEHKLCFVAVSSQGGNRKREFKFLTRFLARDDGSYAIGVGSFADQEPGGVAGIYGYGFTQVASAIVDIVVPKELFAEIPPTGFKRAMWNFVNGSLKGLPDDQCHTRRRFLWVLPLKLLTVVPARIAAGVSLSILGLVLSSVVFFAGWKPAGPWKVIKLVWNFNWPICGGGQEFFDGCMPDHGYTFRVWKVDDSVYPHRVVSKMPIAPWQAVLVAAIGYAGYKWGGLIVAFFAQLLWVRLPGLLVGVAIGLLIVNRKRIRDFWVRHQLTEKLRLPALKAWIGPRLKTLNDKISRWIVATGNRREERRQIRQERRKTTAQNRYVIWLKTELTTAKAPTKVDLRNLPKMFEGKGTVSRRAEVSFWAVKSRVCKPYSRDE